MLFGGIRFSHSDTYSKSSVPATKSENYNFTKSNSEHNLLHCFDEETLCVTPFWGGILSCVEKGAQHEQHIC